MKTRVIQDEPPDAEAPEPTQDAEVPEPTQDAEVPEPTQPDEPADEEPST